MGTKLRSIECRVLRNVRDDDAYWTSDIAHDARVETITCRKVLKELEAKVLVERIKKGNPISWRRTVFGRAALSRVEGNEGGDRG